MKRAEKKLGRMYYFFNGIEMQLMKDTGTTEDLERHQIGNYFDALNTKNARQIHLFLLEISKKQYDN